MKVIREEGVWPRRYVDNFAQLHDIIRALKAKGEWTPGHQTKTLNVLDKWLDK